MWDENRANAWAALRMIREIVEQHAPPGSVLPGEHVGPEYTDGAAAIVQGILAMARPKVIPAKHCPWHELNLQELCRVARLTQWQIEHDGLFQALGGTIEGIEIEML